MLTNNNNKNKKFRHRHTSQHTPAESFKIQASRQLFSCQRQDHCHSLHHTCSNNYFWLYFPQNRQKNSPKFNYNNNNIASSRWWWLSILVSQHPTFNRDRHEIFRLIPHHLCLCHRIDTGCRQREMSKLHNFSYCRWVLLSCLLADCRAQERNGTVLLWQDHSGSWFLEETLGFN